MTTARRGKFIVFEGIDGSGTTTHSKLLVDWMNARGQQTILVREPVRESHIGKLINAALKNDVWIQPKALLHLFIADRIQHLEETVIPALDEGTYVVSDRHTWSTYAYQSVANAASNRELTDLLRQEGACIDVDLLIYLDCDPIVAMKRVSKRTNETEIFEQEAFLTEVRRAYYDTFHYDSGPKTPVSTHIFDTTTATKEQTFNRIKTVVGNHLYAKGLLHG